MSEQLAEIFKGLPTDVLLKENTRIEVELANLIARRELIIEALVERYDPEL